MKTENEARRGIIREWMSLPREKRETEEQAAAFALKAIKTLTSDAVVMAGGRSWPG